MLRFLQKVRLQNKRRFDRIVGINVKGAFFAVQAVLPSMRKRKNGAIIIVGSDQTLVGKPGQNLYGLTKGALGQFAKSTGAQYAPEGIRVNCVRGFCDFRRKADQFSSES